MEEIGEDKKPLLADGNQEDNLFNQPSNQKKLSIIAKVLIVAILLIVVWAVVAIAVIRLLVNIRFNLFILWIWANNFVSWCGAVFVFSIVVYHKYI